MAQSAAPGMYGAFTIDAAGAWTYTLDNALDAVQGLSAGSTADDVFTVTASVNSAATQDITITITGANDAPTVTLVASSPTGIGNSDLFGDELNPGGVLTLTATAVDPDVNDALTFAWTEVPRFLDASLGSFSDATAAVTTWTAPASIANLYTTGLTVTVGDGATSTSQTFLISLADNVLAFTAPIPDQFYPQDDAISDLTLPAATGEGLRGIGTPTTYALDPVPAGLTFDDATRILSGTPTDAATSATTHTYTATDGESRISITFTINDFMPEFAATIADQRYPTGESIALTLPEPTSGNTPLSYTLTPALPGDLTFDDTTRVLGGTTPDTTQAATTYTYTVTDNEGDTAQQTFTITITDGSPNIVLAGGLRMTADEGEVVTLNAADSSDIDGQAITRFQWTEDPANEPPVTLSDRTAAAPTFTAPEERTTLNFDLTITDGSNRTATATITVQVGRSQFDTVHRTILPEVTRAMVDTTVSAIARRVEHAATKPDASAATFNLGGQSTLADVLQSNGEALTNGTFKVKSLLGRSAFALPLNQAGGPLAGVTLWGNGAYRNLSGNSSTVDWDGDLFGATVGGDAQLTETMLTGLAVSWADGTFDYTDSSSGADEGRGTYQATLTSLHPYISTSLLDGQVTLWATGGYGWGEIEITDTADPTAEGTVTADTRLATAAVGGAGSLLNRPGLLTPDGTTTVRVKAEALTTAIKAEQQGDRLAGLTTDARRLRLTLEGSHAQPLLNGAHLTPSIGVGLRHDAGDGRTGTGAEVSGGLRYEYPALRLTMESRGRVLLAHGGDYEDWSVSGRVTLAPGSAGQGLAVTLAPTYQTTTSASGLAELWEQGTANRPAPSGPTTPQGLMAATVAYGLPVGDHLLTPYGGMTLGAADARTYRLGSRVRLAHRLNMSLEGARKGATGTAPVDHGVRLQLEWNW